MAAQEFGHSQSLSTLGLGLFYAWGWIHYMSSVFYPNVGAPLMMARADWLCALGVSQFIWLPIILSKSRTLSLVRRRVVIAGAPLLMAIGTGIIATTRGDSAGSWAQLLIGATLAGLGTGTMPVMWGEMYGRLDTRRASVGMSLSAILAMLIYFAVNAIPNVPVQVIISALLPVGSGVLLWFSAQRVSQLNASEEARPRPRRSPLRLAIIPAGYGIVYGVLIGMTDFLSATGVPSTGAVSVVGGAIGAALLLAGVIIFSRKVDILGFTFWPIVPVLAVGIALLPFVGNPLISAGLVLSGFLVFDLITYVICSDIAFRLGVSAVKIFALGRSASHAGVLIGIVTGSLVIRSVEVSQGSLMTTSLVMLYVLMFALAFALNQHNVISGWGFVPPEELPKQTRANSPVHAMAASFKLSKREEEVLELLVQGRSLPHIGEALFLSLGTVKYHVHNIYGKFGVHARQALIDRVEEQIREDAAHKADSVAGRSDTAGGQ